MKWQRRLQTKPNNPYLILLQLSKGFHSVVMLIADLFVLLTECPHLLVQLLEDLPLCHVVRLEVIGVVQNVVTLLTLLLTLLSFLGRHF